jgi:glycine oxidase
MRFTNFAKGKSMRIAIIGNGAVGMMIAYKLSQNKNVNIVLFGDSRRIGAGSKAAGAMLVAFSELETDQLENETLHKRFTLAEQSLREWPELLMQLSKDSDVDLNVQHGIKVAKAQDTTPFEEEQFKYLNKIEDLYPDDVKLDNNLIYLPSELSLDARKYLQAMSSYLTKQSNVSLVNANARYSFSGINEHSCTLSWDDGGNSESYDHVVIAAGSRSREIMLSDMELFDGIPDIYYGIGSALLIEDVKENNYVTQTGSKVMRTMNRGGACGYHLVNCGSYYYFGATNAIHHKPEFKPRIESLSNLTEYLKKEFSEDFALQLAEPIVGFRPTTADTLPLLGGIKNDRIIFATGNKRDGLTCSPQVANEVINIIMGKQRNFLIFKPKRHLLSYFDQNKAIVKTAKSHLSGRYFHGQLKMENWDHDLKIEIERLEEIYKRLDVAPDFGIHPEVLNMFIHNRINLSRLHA